MSSPTMARAAGEAPALRPWDYGHLQRLAARYARTRLAGRSITNRATGRRIRLDWPQGLRGAVAPGTPPELLLALPALPALLADARPLGSGDDPRRRHNVRRIHGFAASAEITGRPLALWLVAREDRNGGLAFDGIVPQSPLIAPREDGGELPDLPGARTRALRLVLARGARVQRQDGGGTPDGADDQFGAKPDEPDPSSDAPAPEPAPPLQPPDAAPKPSEEANVPKPASGGVDTTGLVTPEGRLDQEAIFYRRKARLAELQAKGLDPKTDPDYRRLSQLFVLADRQKDEDALTFAFPEARVETTGAEAVESAEPWIEREIAELFSRGAERAPTTGAAPARRNDAPALATPAKSEPAASADASGSPSNQALQDKAPQNSHGEGWKEVPDWAEYPEGVPRPEGPIRRTVGLEYRTARKAADNANRRFRRANPEAVKGKEVHELKPVFLGGDPVDLRNKAVVTPSLHGDVHRFWLRIKKAISGD